jgi:hypothetical protein
LIEEEQIRKYALIGEIINYEKDGGSMTGNAEHPPTKAMLYIGLFVGVWIVVCLVILGALKIESGWPAFLTLPLIFLAGPTKENITNCFVGGTVGLIITWLLTPVVTFLATSAGLGMTPAILLTIFVILFLIIGLGSTVPMVFNNFNLVFFTVAIIFPTQHTLLWIGLLIIGGLVFTGGTLLFIQKALPKLMTPKAPEA